MNKYSRREFLEYSLTVAAGAALLPVIGCGPSSTDYKGLLAFPENGYPLIEVSGSHNEIGRQIGAAMKDRIRGYFDVAGDYIDSVAYFEGEGRSRVEAMLAHARDGFPGLIDELEGMAEALEVPFMHLFSYNCRSEIGLLKDPPGCSTIAVKKGDNVILVHNEDGNDLNVGRMFLARVDPPSGVSFLAFIYPGLLPGNGPAVNIHGIVETTNYIQPRRVVEGIPRYFLSRAILESRDLDEAVSIATMKPRSFSFHHNLVSLNERRILSVETAAYPEHRHDILEVEGFYVHTNHFLHPAMVEGAEQRPYDVPYISSTTRMDVLTR
ncbi:MAG: C45 family peptidase, partial [Bacteroidales bacterium]|nr:C45 family peptidase [Candidatus Latescibacterota bacterium]